MFGCKVIIKLWRLHISVIVEQYSKYMDGFIIVINLRHGELKKSAIKVFNFSLLS